MVLTAYSDSCKLLMERLPHLRESTTKHHRRGVRFFFIDSFNNDLVGTSTEKKTPPVLQDPSGLISSGLQFTHIGETIIVDPRSWEIVFRGALDYEEQLSAFLSSNGHISDTSSVQLPCPIDYSGLRDLSVVSYQKDIAPLLIEKCVGCHRTDGIAPWAMTSHAMVRGFSPMIREVVRTGRMPPWHADTRIGRFSNDRSLTATEAQKLVAWIEAGSHYDGKFDPLTEAARRGEVAWTLGTPDLVLEIPPFDVPPTGVVDYQYHVVKTELPHHVWLRATELIPGDPAAVHHVLASVGDGVRFGTVRLAGAYAPGQGVLQWTRKSGMLMRSGATLSFQMHYTTYGRRSIDRSRIGLYFHDAKPAHEVKTAALLHTAFQIPPRVKSHRVNAERIFLRPVRLFAVSPHAHYRGKAALFEAIGPAGERRTLLSVPNFDFNWQTIYYFEDPVDLEAGTTVKHTTWWDNSPEKAGNPDPNATVRWGSQSWDEMAIGWVLFRYLDD